MNNSGGLGYAHSTDTIICVTEFDFLSLRYDDSERKGIDLEG